MYKYVRPAKVIAALEWLKVNNPLYQSDAAQDDTELWDALSSQHSHCQSSQGVAVQARVDTASMSPERSIRDSARDQVDEDMGTLTSLARDRGFVVLMALGVTSEGSRLSGCSCRCSRRALPATDMSAPESGRT